MPEKREQQKVWLHPATRRRLREEASARDMELSAVVEHLINDGEYPTKDRER